MYIDLGILFSFPFGIGKLDFFSIELPEYTTTTSKGFLETFYYIYMDYLYFQFNVEIIKGNFGFDV